MQKPKYLRSLVARSNDRGWRGIAKVSYLRKRGVGEAEILLGTNADPTRVVEMPAREYASATDRDSGRAVP